MSPPDAPVAPVPATPPALTLGDPPPFRWLNEDGRTPILILGDHAGRAVPACLGGPGGLGVGDTVMARHVAYDIGVEPLVEAMAHALDAPAILGTYSRLVIDPNRQLADPTLICAISDGMVIPRNRAVDAADRAWRVETLYAPYHAAIESRLDRFAADGVAPVVVSLHSFTPALRSGTRRPWAVGILWNEDPRLPVPLLAALRARGLVVGDNEPYDGRNAHGCTMESHVYPRGLPNALIEVRNDLIERPEDAAFWGRRLADVLREVLAGLGGGAEPG